MKKALSVVAICVSLFMGTASAFAAPLELPPYYDDVVHAISE